MGRARLGSGVKTALNPLPPPGESYDKNISSVSSDMIGWVNGGYDIGRENESQGHDMDLLNFIL